MSPVLDGRTVLVTGGTGSIGKHIVYELLKHNVRQIIVFSRDEIKQYVMKRMLNDERVHYVTGDIRDYRALRRVFEQFEVDLVYHAAAMKHVTICEANPLEAVYTNILGTQNLVDLAKEYGVSKLINISTDKAVYPTTVMGASKLIAERIVMNANYTTVRFGNVSCTRGSVIPVLLKEMISKRQLTITDPNVTRFVMKIQDAVKLVLEATKMARGGEIFILKMKSFKLSDLVSVLLDHIAPKLGIPSNDVRVNIIGLLPGEKLHEHLIDDQEAANLQDLGNMYVIRRKAGIQVQTKVIPETSSEKAPRVSESELVELVEECYKLMTQSLI